jgi:hypothetical protein
MVQRRVSQTKKLSTVLLLAFFAQMIGVGFSDFPKPQRNTFPTASTAGATQSIMVS